MVKPEWGQKRQCQSCAARFYDMLRSPIHCPKCGTVFEPEAQLKSRRRAEPKVAVKPKAVVVDELADDLEVEEIDDEDGDGVPELEEIDEAADDVLADDVTPEDALLGVDDDAEEAAAEGLLEDTDDLDDEDVSDVIDADLGDDDDTR